MAMITVRDIDDDVKAKLRIRAAENGRSMEAEVREILKAAVDVPRVERGLGTRIHQRFAPFGGVELEIPPREVDDSRVPDFSDWFAEEGEGDSAEQDPAEQP